MDVHLTEVRDIANLLEEVDVNIPEDIIVYYTLKNLPKEYELFKRMQIAAQTLPTYEQLEAKLISEETSIRMEYQQKEDGKTFFLHCDQTRRPQSAPRHSHFSTALNSRHHRRYADSGGSSAPRFSNQTDSGGLSAPRSLSQTTHFGLTQRGNTLMMYQPRYRSRGPDKQWNGQCNFCGLDGHFERECDLISILYRIKYYEHRLLERRNRTFNG